jgi:hypothetical protein
MAELSWEGILTGVHLDTVLTDVMNRLADVGRSFGDAWGGHQRSISSYESGIGTDRLAAAFLPNYRTVQASLRQAAGDVPAICESCAAVGHRSVADYLERDQNAARQFRGLSGGDHDGR